MPDFRTTVTAPRTSTTTTVRRTSAPIVRGPLPTTSLTSAARITSSWASCGRKRFSGKLGQASIWASSLSDTMRTTRVLPATPSPTPIPGTPTATPKGWARDRISAFKPPGLGLCRIAGRSAAGSRWTSACGCISGILRSMVRELVPQVWNSVARLRNSVSSGLILRGAASLRFYTRRSRPRKAAAGRTR